MPRKKTPVRAPWTKEDLRQLKGPLEGEDTCGGRRQKAMKRTDSGGGPAKGEDNRHRSWSSSLRTLTLIGSPEGSLTRSWIATCAPQFKERDLRACRPRLENRRSTSHLPVNRRGPLRCSRAIVD